MPLQQSIDTIYLWVSKQRNTLMSVLLSVNWLVVALICIAVYSTAVEDAYSAQFYSFARECGEYAALLFILVSIPGIARRFRYNHKFIMILMTFRRQLGVLMYLFALLHSLVLRIIPWIAKQIPLRFETEIFPAMIASMLLFTLFITSNDWSVKNLGDWWNRIQRMMYIIVWFIFAHIALVGLSKWTVLIGITSVLQVSSHIYAKKRLKSLN